jgi:quercetin dioxygenase-like cupin family protein
LDTSKVDRSLAKPDPTMTRWIAGEARFQSLVDPAQGHDVGLTAVFFEAGARTRPHVHSDEQVLYFVEGRGVVATESETHRTAAGDIVAVPAGTWHWHGATPDAAACHISIKRPGPTNWEVEEKNWGMAYQ